MLTLAQGLEPVGGMTVNLSELLTGDLAARRDQAAGGVPAER
jgi:hypothetical protein